MENNEYKRWFMRVQLSDNDSMRSMRDYHFEDIGIAQETSLYALAYGYAKCYAHNCQFPSNAPRLIRFIFASKDTDVDFTFKCQSNDVSFYC